MKVTDFEARANLLKKMPGFPRREGGFKLLYPDCPWNYRDKANSGNRGAIHKYETLSLQELMMMRQDIDRISAPDCALGMWATAPMMWEARELMKAWGFKYSTVALVWIKTVAVADRLQKVSKKLKISFEDLVQALAEEGLTVMRPKKGMGNWTRSNAEFLLLGTKGKVERINKGIGSIIVSEPREHSRKPDEARERLVELFGDIPRLEMFSRESAPGWDVWGLEVGLFDPKLK